MPSNQNKQLATARRYWVVPSSSTVYQLTNEAGKHYIVNLRERTCFCAQFCEYWGPCSHAIQAAKAVHVDTYTLFREEYLVSEYAQGYQSSIPPILFQDLVRSISKHYLLPDMLAGFQQCEFERWLHYKTVTNRCSNIWCRERGHKKGFRTIQIEGEVIDRADED